MNTRRSKAINTRVVSYLSGPRFMEDLSPLLHQATSAFLSPSECQRILKGLMVFADETPVAASSNLFEEDQATQVNVYNVTSVTEMKNRNWQWILQVFSPKNPTAVSPQVGLLQELCWRKSMAVLMGRLMMTSTFVQDGRKISGSACRLVIGYWIHKLYEARFPALQFHEIPDSVRAAYHGFLAWQGYQWMDKKLPFDVFSKLNLTLFCSQKVTRGKKQRSLADKDISLLITESEVSEFCKGIGTKGLEMYLRRGFTGSLEEFRVEFWESEPPKTAALVDIKSEVMEVEEVTENEVEVIYQVADDADSNFPFKKRFRRMKKEDEVDSKELADDNPIFQLLESVTFSEEFNGLSERADNTERYR